MSELWDAEDWDECVAELAAAATVEVRHLPSGEPVAIVVTFPPSAKGEQWRASVFRSPEFTREEIRLGVDALRKAGRAFESKGLN